MANRDYLKILLVEDEVPKQEHILNSLREIRPLAKVAIARSVRSAIEAMQSTPPPQLMLLDMSLPTFDVGPKESGGRPQNFGGVEVLRYMDLYELHFPTIVITAYEAFSRAGRAVDHGSLDEQLREEHPKSYRGLIYYNSLFSEWRTALSGLIKSIEDAVGK